MHKSYKGMSLSQESKLKRNLSEEEKNQIKKRFWRYLFLTAKKIRVDSDDELGKIVKLKSSQIKSWRKRPDKTVPFYHSNHYKGIAVESFYKLANNLQKLYGNFNYINSWLRTPTEQWKYKTPLDFIKEESFGIHHVNEHLKSVIDECEREVAEIELKKKDGRYKKYLELKKEFGCGLICIKKSGNKK